MDEQGVLWAGTDAGLVAIPDNQPAVVYPCAGAARAAAVRGLAARDEGVVACLADESVIHAAWVKGTPRARRVTHLGRAPRVLTTDRRGRLWVGSACGVTVLDETQPGAGERYAQADGLPGHGVWAVLCAEEDRVWAATSAGLVLLQGQAPLARAVPSAVGGDDIPAYAIAHDTRGRTWVASESGLAVFDGERRLTLPSLPPALTRETCWSLQPAADGTMWVGTRRDGVWRLHPDTGLVLDRYAEGRDVPSLAIADDRYLCACVSNGGLLIADLQGQAPPRWVRAGDGLPDDRALCVGATAGGVAVGGWNGWVAVLDPAEAALRGHVLLPGAAAGQPVTDVCMAPGGEDALWVASYGGGLLNLDPHTLTVRRGFTTNDSLPSNLVYACRADARGHIWVGTRRGVARLSPASGRSVVIGRSLGLPSDESNGQSLSIDARGRVWSGTVRGAAVIDAPGIPDTVPPCTVHVSGLSVMGQKRAITPAVRIEDSDYDVVFEYGAVTYTAAAQTLYRVRLDGLDAAWSRPSRQRSTRYTNLACGAYTFHVQARNWGGVWSEAATLPFVVTRSAAGRALDRARVQAEAAEAARIQAEAAVQVRNQVLSGVVHDLRSPLTTIMGQAQLLHRSLERGEPAPEQVGARMTALEKAASRMTGMLQEISDVIQLDRGHALSLQMTTVDLAGVIDAAVAPFGATHEHGHGGPTLEVAVEPGLTVYGDVNHLTRVVENIAGNAVKYSSQDTLVRVEAHACGNEAMIMVTDQGVGIPANEVAQIFTPYFRASTARWAPGTGLGLAGARAIVEQHGGEIHLHSVEGKGTTVTVVLPRDAAHG
jgi:signal transduction histidine kinase/streptogramin lyase